MYFGFYEKMKHRAITKYTNRLLTGYTDEKFSLTKAQGSEVRAFYEKYLGKKISLASHRFYAQKSGVFDPRFIPMCTYLNVIDEYFNNRAESKFLDNKCYYPILFAGIRQPKILAMRMGGLWYSGDRELITTEDVKALINAETKIFAKQATASCGGKGVACIEAENGNMYTQLEEFLNQAKGDVVIQRGLEQHENLSAVNKNSVNTIRVMSLLTQEGVKIYSAMLRLGVGESRVDNVSSGGVTCGITESGILKAKLYKLNGESFDAHPTNGFRTDGYQLVGFDAAKELIRKAHPMVPHFRLVSWDIAIDKDGNAVLIEANLSKGSSEFLQLNNGPLFGDDTEKILDEVFGK